MARFEVSVIFTQRAGCKYVIEAEDKITQDDIAQILSEMSGQKKEFIRLSLDGAIVKPDVEFKAPEKFFMIVSEEWDDGQDAVDSGELMKAMNDLGGDDDEGCAQM